MATMAENVIAARSKTRPSMLEKGMYDSRKTRIILYIRGKENGEMLKDSIDNGPYQFKAEITVKDTDGVIDIRCPQRLEDLIGQDKLRYDSDIKAINILLLRLPMTKQERESMLYDEFDKFTSEPGESIHSYYLRYAKLINDMKMTSISMLNMQINTKFVNHLQPKWSRFITSAKQARNIHNANFDQLYAFLKHNEKDAKEVREMRQRFLEPLALPMLVAQAQEAGVILNDEQHDFLADSLEETNDSTTNEIFMVNLSPVGSLNDDMVEPRYDSDILYKVPHYDTYHNSDMLNSNIQELGYIENIVSNNESYDELTSNSNVLSYTDYMLTIGNDEDNYVPPLVQKNDMMMSVIEQMKSQVEKLTLLPKSKVIPKVVKKNDLSKSVTSHLTTNNIIEKCTKVLATGLHKIEYEPINAYIKNNRAAHHDYLNVTKEHVTTLHELLKEARALKPLDEHIGHASKFAEQIQELVMYVSASCPFTQSGNENVVSTLISAATVLLSYTARASSSTSIDKDAPSPTKEESKNYKESMIKSSWIEAMQEEIHEFERLDVWKLVPRPDKAMIISLNWIFKVKLNEYGGVLKNKARLVTKGYR
nr:integrase, catalytic region, zinc finger, CCHC-type, peptidase aspartic, catalytic [Tanacetum cinerariifolium]